MKDLPIGVRTILDDIGTGAILKHIRTGRRAVVIEYGERELSGWLTVCMVRDSTYRKERLNVDALGPNHFELTKIRDFDEWIVLANGSNEILTEDL
jgi:hypothetical protein